MEDAYVIKGGRPLKGSVKLSGAKNVALKVIVSALMFDNEVVLHNIPRIKDVFELMHLIKLMGGKAEFTGNNTTVIDGSLLKTDTVDLLHASKIRVSFMLFAPLLHRFQTCMVPNPGGCRIGARPIDRIIEGMKEIGIKVTYDTTTGYYNAKSGKPVEGSYTFLKPSHTGTELLILLSLFGKNTIILNNCALEPEIDELIRFLNESGANIQRNETAVIIYPSKKLHQNKPFSIVSDRNEAITYATLALATEGDITLGQIPYSLIKTFVEKIQLVGGGFEKINYDSCRFFYKNQLKALSIETSPHPGFMTDWQPNWAILMTHAKGESVINERIFENRFSYVEELKKVGADIEYINLPVQNPKEFFFFNYDQSKKYKQSILIKGPQQLHGGVLNIADLRAGATLAIAAFAAEGESVINGASILERGYEDFVKKTRLLGGDIRTM